MPKILIAERKTYLLKFRVINSDDPLIETNAPAIIKPGDEIYPSEMLLEISDEKLAEWKAAATAYDTAHTELWQAYQKAEEKLNE